MAPLGDSRRTEEIPKPIFRLRGQGGRIISAKILPLNKTEKSKNRRRELWETKARRIKVRRKPKKSLRKTNRRSTKKTSPAISNRSTHMRGGSHQPAPIPSEPFQDCRHLGLRINFTAFHSHPLRHYTRLTFCLTPKGSSILEPYPGPG